jgi:hypothetical protein
MPGSQLTNALISRPISTRRLIHIAQSARSGDSVDRSPLASDTVSHRHACILGEEARRACASECSARSVGSLPGSVAACTSKTSCVTCRPLSDATARARSRSWRVCSVGNTRTSRVSSEARSSPAHHRPRPSCPLQRLAHDDRTRGTRRAEFEGGLDRRRNVCSPDRLEPELWKVPLRRCRQEIERWRLRDDG